MNPTMKQNSLGVNSTSAQVIEMKQTGLPKTVLRQTALAIAYSWLFRKQAEMVLARRYGLPRPVIEEIVREVMLGEHGPFVVPAARVEKLAA